MRLSTTTRKDLVMDSERLDFGIWQNSDEALAFKLWGNPKVTRFISAKQRLSFDEVMERLEAEIVSLEEDDIQYWPLFQKSDGDFVGCCGLKMRSREENVLELGFQICEGHWRKGYAMESSLRVIEHAFSDLRVNALFAGHHPKNVPSRNLLIRLGFRFVENEFYAPTGRMHPGYMLYA